MPKLENFLSPLFTNARNKLDRLSTINLLQKVITYGHKKFITSALDWTVFERVVCGEDETLGKCSWHAEYDHLHPMQQNFLRL